jgi:hypothetical protein
MTEHALWPSVPYAEWAPTKKTLQAFTQFAGKTRLALSPTEPQWLHSSLSMTARGFTTGPMPVTAGPAAGRAVEVRFDLFDDAILIDCSCGDSERIPLVPDRCVSAVWADYLAAFDRLGVEFDVWSKPQEVDDVTPFELDCANRTYDPAAVRRWFTALTSIERVFAEFRSPFFGRTALPFWWGAFDLAVLLFTGEKAEVRPGSNYIMRHDLDAQFLNAGFWPGNDEAPTPMFYAYVYPQPPGCGDHGADPNAHTWVEQMGEWMLSYDDVRTSDDPDDVLRGWLTSVLQFAGTAGAWPLERFTYTPPALPDWKKERP